MLNFVNRVRSSQIAWLLRLGDRLAAITVPGYEGQRVIPVWSDQVYASKAREDNDEWTKYAPADISLDSMLGSLLPSLHKDRTPIIPNPNWHHTSDTVVVHPLKLKYDIQPDTFHDELRVDIGRSTQGTFVRVVHIPSGQSLMINPAKEGVDWISWDLKEQLRNQLNLKKSK